MARPSGSRGVLGRSLLRSVDSPHELGLGHRGAPLDVGSSSLLIELVARVRPSAPLCDRSPPRLPDEMSDVDTVLEVLLSPARAGLVHGSGRDLLSQVRRVPAVQEPILDVLILLFRGSCSNCWVTWVVAPLPMTAWSVSAPCCRPTVQPRVVSYPRFPTGLPARALPTTSGHKTCSPGPGRT